MRAPAPLSTGWLPRLSYWVLTLALVLLSGLGIAQALLLRRDLQVREREDLERELRALAASMEETLRREISPLLARVGESPESQLQELEQALQSELPWFDALYVWMPPQDEDPLFVYPRLQEVMGREELHSARCLLPLTLSSMASPYFTASLLRRCRLDPRPAVRVYASLHSARLLLELGRPLEADEALRELRLDPVLSLEQGRKLGIATEWVLEHHLLLSETQAQLGGGSYAVPVLTWVAEDLARQTGPVLEGSLERIEQEILPRLRELGAQREAGEVDAWLMRAQRRKAGWEEARVLATRGAPPAWGEPVQLTIDPYGEVPFLLFFSQLPDLERSAALQMDAAALVERLLEREARLPPELMVLDARPGRPLPADEDLAASVPLMSLPHLQLAFPARVLSDRSDLTSRSLWPLLPSLLAGLLGGLALLSRLAADRRARQLQSMHTEFTARVTHELKTPLTGILLMAESMQLSPQLDEETRSTFLKRIMAEGQRLSERVDEILAITREPAPHEPQQLVLHQLVRERLEPWLPRLHDQGITVEVELQEIRLWADPRSLGDALACLLDNAIKYRRSGEDAWCSVRLWRAGKQAVLEVTDNGIGVPVERRESIFERFVRVEGPDRGLAGGYGLGLSFVAEAARRHGGSVYCRDGREGGSCFGMRLPLQPSPWWRRASPWTDWR